MKRYVSMLCAVLLITTSLTLPIFAKKHEDRNPIKVSFADKLPADGNLIIGIFTTNEGFALGQYAQSIDTKTNGALSHAIKVSGISGEAMTATKITAPMNSGFEQILVIGLGQKDSEHSASELQDIGGNAAQQAVIHFKTLPSLILDVSAHSAAEIAMGAKLGSYFFDKYYTDTKRQKSQQTLNVVTSAANEADKLYRIDHDPVARAIWFTRNISNEPANVIYPESFVKLWRSHFKGLDNLKIKVYDEKDMIKRGMGAIHAVGKGSNRPPRLMIVEYMGNKKSDENIVIAGKGVTFDTGGISLKNPQNMWNMKFDMSGAASTMGIIYALASREAKVNVIGIAGLAENMPGPDAFRPGDVLTSLSGKTISIRSTDAEGRLILADAVYYGDNKYNPVLLFDMATLTGSARRALGNDYAALFTRHDELVDKFVKIGIETGDQVWHLPLNANHFKAIEHNVADIMNSGPSAPGASAGAAFIGAFVRETTNWVHLDVAGVAWNDSITPTKSSPGSPGYGIRLMNEYIKTYHEAE